MRVFKASNKNGQRVIEMYNRLTGYYLSDIYNNYSVYKARAWDECHTLFINEGGTRFRVGSANSFGFTCGWVILDDLGRVEKVRVETKETSYCVYMNV